MKPDDWMAALAQLTPGATPEEIADILWLATRMGPMPSSVSTRLLEHSADGSEEPTSSSQTSQGRGWSRSHRRLHHRRALDDIGLYAAATVGLRREAWRAS